MLQKSGDSNQLRLVVEIPLFTYTVLYIPGGCLGFLNYQQYFHVLPSNFENEPIGYGHSEPWFHPGREADSPGQGRMEAWLQRSHWESPFGVTYQGFGQSKLNSRRWSCDSDFEAMILQQLPVLQAELAKVDSTEDVESRKSNPSVNIFVHKSWRAWRYPNQVTRCCKVNRIWLNWRIILLDTYWYWYCIFAKVACWYDFFLANGNDNPMFNQQSAFRPMKPKDSKPMS